MTDGGRCACDSELFGVDYVEKQMTRRRDDGSIASDVVVDWFHRNVNHVSPSDARHAARLAVTGVPIALSNLCP